MKTLFFGAGPLGSLYAHLLHQSGADVTVLARGARHDWLMRNGVVVVNGMTGEQAASPVKVVGELRPDDQYDLAIVLIRKNKLPPVFAVLEATPGVKNVLFMGNNALGFDAYVKRLPAEKLLFGFPGAGGGIREQVVHYADREKPNGRRKAVVIGEIDGQSKDRTSRIASLFESAEVPVDLTTDIDAWLKYHVALFSPLACALYKNDCDGYRTAQDGDTLRLVIRAAREGGRVLRALGCRRRPFRFTLVDWLPESANVIALKRLLTSKFAEVAFAMHAQAARDEMGTIALELQELAARTSVETPSLDTLRRHLVRGVDGHLDGQPPGGGPTRSPD